MIKRFITPRTTMFLAIIISVGYIVSIGILSFYPITNVPSTSLAHSAGLIAIFKAPLRFFGFIK